MPQANTKTRAHVFVAKAASTTVPHLITAPPMGTRPFLTCWFRGLRRQQPPRLLIRFRRLCHDSGLKVEAVD